MVSLRFLVRLGGGLKEIQLLTTGRRTSLLVSMHFDVVTIVP